MLFPEGDGTNPPEEGDGVLGLFLLPNSLFGSRAMSLLPLLPLACLLKLSTYIDEACLTSDFALMAKGTQNFDSHLQQT